MYVLKNLYIFKNDALNDFFKIPNLKHCHNYYEFLLGNTNVCIMF